MPVTHQFVSAKADGPDPTIVRPSDWNAVHVSTIADAVTTGELSSTDWNTFNAKQSALTADVDYLTPGTAASTYQPIGSYLTAETDPIVGAINGIVKANGAGVISAASAGTDYQAPLTNPVTGTGATGQVGYWSGTNALTGSANFTWDEVGRALILADSLFGSASILGKAVSGDTGTYLTIAAGNSDAQGGLLKLLGSSSGSGIVSGGIELKIPDCERPGRITVTGGSATSGNYDGTYISLTAGNGNLSGQGGNVDLLSGNGGINGDGGDVTVTLGKKGAGGSQNGRFRLNLAGGYYAQFAVNGISGADTNYDLPNVSGTMTLGAGTLTSATANDVTVANHTHAITPSLGLLSNADAQYKVLVSGATPFAPAYSGFLLDGTTGGKTVFAVTNTKTLTLTATDSYNLTVPATGTAALLGTANVFSALNTFNGNIGLAEDDYIGYPSVIGASYMPTEGSGYNSILNTLNTLYVNLDSGAAGAARALIIAKGRTGISGGTEIFKFATDGNVALYLENSFFGYPGSTAQGFTPFTSSYNFIYNSLFNHVWNIDSGNSSTTQKFIWGHNGTSETPTEIASLTEAGVFSIASPGYISSSTQKQSGIVQALPETYISGTGTAGTDNTAMDVKSITIPANTLTQLGDRIRIRTYQFATVGPNILGTLKFNGVTIAVTPNMNSTDIVVEEIYLHYIDNTHANILHGNNLNNTALNVAGFDWSSAQDLVISQNAVSSQHLVVAAMMVDRFPKGI